MGEIKLPIKYEIRSRAKILTEEAFRGTRNYLKISSNDYKYSKDGYDVYADLYKKKSDKGTEKNLGELYAKTFELREILNKISKENYDQYINTILKYDYDEELLENFKNLIYAKAVTEKKYCELYIKICYEMFKFYNKKYYPNIPEMDFKNSLLKRCREEFYSPNETKIAYPFNMGEVEQKAMLVEIKLGNIRLISNFYINNILPLKAINECMDFLIEKIDDLNIRTLCELVKKCCMKLYTEDLPKLEMITEELEKL